MVKVHGRRSKGNVYRHPSPHSKGKQTKALPLREYGKRKKKPGQEFGFSVLDDPPLLPWALFQRTGLGR